MKVHGAIVAPCYGCIGWHRGAGVSHNHCDLYQDEGHDRLSNGHGINSLLETGKHTCWQPSAAFKVHGGVVHSYSSNGEAACGAYPWGDFYQVIRVCANDCPPISCPSCIAALGGKTCYPDLPNLVADRGRSNDGYVHYYRGWDRTLCGLETFIHLVPWTADDVTCESCIRVLGAAKTCPHLTPAAVGIQGFCRCSWCHQTLCHVCVNVRSYPGMKSVWHEQSSGLEPSRGFYTAEPATLHTTLCPQCAADWDAGVRPSGKPAAPREGTE